MLNFQVENKDIEKKFEEIINFFGNLELALKDMVKREEIYISEQKQLIKDERLVIELMKNQNWSKEKVMEFLKLGGIFEDPDTEIFFEKIRKEMNVWRT